MCGNCGQIVANTSRLLLQTPRTDSLGAALGLSDWLLENDIKYIAVCLPANWLPLEWPLLSTSVSRSKWAVIVAMINGQLSRKPGEGGSYSETRMRQRKLYAGCGVGPSDEEALGFVIICDLC